MNDQAVVVGFVENPPTINILNNGTRQCQFTLMVKNTNTEVISRVPCTVIGPKAELCQIKCVKGAFVAIAGRHRTKMVHMKGYAGGSAPLLELVITEIEFLNIPELPGIGVEEFVKQYSPEGLTAIRKGRAEGKNV